MMVLAGADLVLPDRVLPGGSLVIEGDRIAAIEPRTIDAPSGVRRLDLAGCTIVPGFVDVHVHGVEGHDTLAGAEAVREIAARLPRYGVTSFCPTSVACDPATLSRMLVAIEQARAQPHGRAARVLPAHLESNFVNPEYRGAQPAACLRVPRGHSRSDTHVPSEFGGISPSRPERDFTGTQILDVIAAHRSAIAIVTLAPELDGSIDLVRALATAGHIVSIGHSGATYEQAHDAIRAGVRHATHLFNRMSPMRHRAPGVPGAVLEAADVAAELICDGFHVHPALMQITVRAKGEDAVMAITDGTAGSGLPVGTRARLGGQPILVTDRTATLEDGTMAGSVLTMDGAFRVLVQRVGLTVVQAARLCATTPARRLGLRDVGCIEPGAVADLAILDPDLRVRDTCLAGQLWRNGSAPRVV